MNATAVKEIHPKLNLSFDFLLSILVNTLIRLKVWQYCAVIPACHSNQQVRCPRDSLGRLSVVLQF